MKHDERELDEQPEVAPEVTKELTFGQKAVSLRFNPNNDDKVGQVKQRFSDIIDIIGDPSKDTEKRSYLYSIYRTQAINICVLACMSVVKFITWED